MTQAESNSFGEQWRRSRDELRGISEELAGIADDMRNMARTESELARAEVREQISYAKQTAIWGGVAAVMGVIMLIFAFTALMLALDEAMPLWAAALITFGVTVLLTLIGAALAYRAIRNLTVVPRKTINSMKEDARWARSQLKSSMNLNASETP
ncbi:MAG TPA: phage holin family protein [Tepidiformaceae bacterium]|nr:phage holin family protein [Tepidiformaceae bacterium]HSE43832.1 phage holin family protein [Gemmatimonadales bacterium]